jgi:hypothetical protein
VNAVFFNKMMKDMDEEIAFGGAVAQGIRQDAAGI